jgi:hypothetical protein
VRRLPLLLLLALLLLPAGSALGALPTVFGPVVANPANRLAKLPADPYAYDRAKGCTARPRAGTLALQSWLLRHAGGSSWGILRCAKLGVSSFSLHAEGRAIDWHLDVHRRADRREAERLIRLLLAPDRVGTPHALARRMGIQEIIWDCRAWWSGSAGLRPYSTCFDGEGAEREIDDTTAHRDHIHFGVSAAGARMRTSFWTRRAP